MIGIGDISGIGASSAELLEAAGYVSVRDLARADVGALVTELGRANEALRILKKKPGRRQVEGWVREARRLAGEEGPAPGAAGEAAVGDGEDGPTRRVVGADDDKVVDFEADPAVAEMLENAPLAVPVPVGLMVEQEIRVGDVLQGELLTRVRGDIEIRVDSRPPKREAPASQGGTVRNITPGAPAETLVRRGIDVSKMRSTDDLRRPGAAAPGAPQPLEPRRAERLEVLRAPSEQTNRGRDPRSRRYVRGVLHPHPLQLKAGSLVTLVLQVATPLALAASVLLLLSDLNPERFAWVPKWLLAFPLSLPVLGLLFLVVGAGCTCRVCGQRLFLPRRCRRHVKAHRLPGLGYVFPLALHILFFNWFRCTFCGTAVRLKK